MSVADLVIFTLKRTAERNSQSLFRLPDGLQPSGMLQTKQMCRLDGGAKSLLLAASLISPQELKYVFSS